MEWEHLLSTTRQGKKTHSTPLLPGASRSEFNKDYGRVLYSSAFRRLQDKTQVFPLGRNDYVRTRMTHSLEVANVGRTLAQRLYRIAAERTAPHLLPDPESLVDITATVCLAHDIGNPPFGHSGEEAITSALAGTRFSDYRFEGNAQGFRLLTKVCDPIKGQGLDLTAATLAAFTKYPCSAQTKGEHYKKHGLAAEELSIFASVAELCRLTPLSTPGAWARHPLALLMEAADDISYLIADVEDAFFSKIISYEACLHQLAAMTTDFTPSLAAATLQEQAGQVHLARALAVGACIDRIADVLSAHYESIMRGTFCGSLMSHTSCYANYDEVKKYSIKHIYNHESVIRIEIAGYAVLRGLLEIFMQWVTSPASALGRKIGDILHAPAEADTEHARFLHVIDYLSGMTDSFAQQTYCTLTGRSAQG